MGELVVTPWKQGRAHRLYVRTEGGAEIGYRDLKTGIDHLDDDAFRAPFRAAIDRYLRDQDRPSTSPVVAVTTPAGTSDLATNVAGQAARERANAEYAAMQEESRIRAWLARTLDVKTDERNWRVGADGEEAVGKLLDRLRQHGWYVLHAVPIGERGSDIDHVVIGHGGVYTVNTKFHPGGRVWVSPNQMRVNGNIVPYLRNSRFEADRTAKLLSAAVGWDVPVRGTLVLLTGSRQPNVTLRDGGPTDVLVLTRPEVPRIFLQAPQRISAHQVAELFETARKAETWIPPKRSAKPATHRPTEPTTPPAGWYTNPDNEREWRYWDGQGWTLHTSSKFH